MAEVDKEELGAYLRRVENSRVDLEPLGAYLHHASKAAARLSKTRAANWVAIILVVGLVFSLPLAVFSSLFVDTEQAKLLESVFEKWYAVVSPILGAVVGALFGISIAGKLRDESE